MSETRLRDGSRVEIRALTGADKDGLAAGLERLSPLSRYRRFLTPTPQFTAGQLAYLTELDHRDREALVAIEPASRDGVAVARYVRSRQHPEEAEFAVAVADEWQRRGVGTLLLRHLAARARAEGITRVSGLVLSDNAPMRHLLETLGEVEVRDTSGGVLEVSMRLPEDPLGEGRGRLAGWLRAAASGHLGTRLGEARARRSRA